MRNSDIQYCKETKKYIFSSEAKAVRSMNKYEDIERVYFCEHCQGFHTTSQEKHPDMVKVEKVKKISRKIKKRLVHLKKKIQKDNL